MPSPSASGIAVAEPAMVTSSVRTLDAGICVHPFRFDPAISVDVPLVPWPRAAATRERLARDGSACLLVVGATDRAPSQWSELEDWVRESASHSEFVARAVTVARRADLRTVPCLEQRVVRFRGRSVTLPDAQVPLVALLVERSGVTVTDPEIRARWEYGGLSTHEEAVKTALRRLRGTLAPLGLELTRVRGAGYLLDRRD